MQVSNTSSIKRSLQELTVPLSKPIFPNNREGKNLWRDHTTKLRANKPYQDSFSVPILYLAWEHPGLFLGRFSRHQGCVCVAAKEGRSCCKSKLILDETFSSFTTTLCTAPALARLLQKDTSIPLFLGSASREWTEQCHSPGHISPCTWQEIEAKIMIWKQIH